MLEIQEPDAGAGQLSAALRARFDPVAVILSPPRSGSTALARSIWQHRAFRYYLHEPFDSVYHDGQPVSTQATLDSVIEREGKPGDGNGIVIKEMTFQVSWRAAELIDATSLPVILLIRDPRLAVSSRMRCREEGGEDPWFPDQEVGWHDLEAIREYLRRSDTDYVVVDISDVRRKPAASLVALCDRFGLASDPAMLSWEQAAGLRLGQLDGRQDHWYARVLDSTGFQPPDEKPPAESYFRDRRMLTVVRDCIALYRQAQADQHFLRVEKSASQESRQVPDRAVPD